jgi:hypothetical protein
MNAPLPWISRPLHFGTNHPLRRGSRPSHHITVRLRRRTSCPVSASGFRGRYSKQRCSFHDLSSPWPQHVCWCVARRSRASFTRYDCTSMAMTSARCTSRSTSETMQAAFGKHLGPFRERAIGDHRTGTTVSAANQFEQVGAAPNHCRARPVREVSGRRSREQRRVPVHECLMSELLCQGRLAGCRSGRSVPHWRRP